MLKFLLPTIKQRKGFAPFGTDNFELGHQRRDPKSQACFVALASGRGLETSQNTPFTAVLSACILKRITISCLKLFEISSQPSGL